jgi:ribosomal protein S18 acetylase RimI-like enzyme
MEILPFRNNLLPGDIGRIIALHGEVYSKDCGFDTSFEVYVAQTLAEAGPTIASNQLKIWLAETPQGELLGCIAILHHHDLEAQLRWFLVHEKARGKGLGKKLLNQAIAYCTTMRFQKVFLYTTASLETASQLYQKAGFQLLEEETAVRWGQKLVFQTYIRLNGGHA